MLFSSLLYNCYRIGISEKSALRLTTACEKENLIIDIYFALFSFVVIV